MAGGGCGGAWWRGEVHYLVNNDNELNILIQKFLKSLNENNTYTLLSIVRFLIMKLDKLLGVTIGSSIKVNNDTDSDIVRRRLKIDINSILFRYGIPDTDI